LFGLMGFLAVPGFPFGMPVGVKAAAGVWSTREIELFQKVFDISTLLGYL